jgi:hypothetical protein
MLVRKTSREGPYLVRTDSSPRTEVLRDWAERIAARRGKMIAVVALARRMAGILYAMMRDAKSYQPARPRLAPRAAAA